MTFRQMVLMNDCIDSGETIEGGTEFAVDLFKAYRPYEKVERLSGIIYKFNTHFTDTVVQSFVDDTVKELSIREKSFLRLFIDWQNFLLADPENPIVAGSAEDTYESSEKDALIAFNDWLVDKLAEEE